MDIISVESPKLTACRPTSLAHGRCWAWFFCFKNEYPLWCSFLSVYPGWPSCTKPGRAEKKKHPLHRIMSQKRPKGDASELGARAHLGGEQGVSLLHLAALLGVGGLGAGLPGARARAEGLGISTPGFGMAPRVPSRKKQTEGWMIFCLYYMLISCLG